MQEKIEGAIIKQSKENEVVSERLSYQFKDLKYFK
jgi:K+-transporting ATPase c subunit